MKVHHLGQSACRLTLIFQPIHAAWQAAIEIHRTATQLFVGFIVLALAYSVSGAYTPPVANNDSATTNEDTAVSIDVLANDTVWAQGELKIESVTSPSNGTAKISSGKVEYTPTANYYGSDSFTYEVQDYDKITGEASGETSTATVNVSVTAVNDDPDAVDDTATTNEDTAVTIDVLDNDSDVESNHLQIDSVSSPSNGTAQISSGEIEYTPDEDYSGTDQFTYVVKDYNHTTAKPLGGSATATVSVTVTSVNDAPVATNDTATTNEDTAVTINVLANDTDADNDTLSINKITTSPTHGTAQISSGEIKYTPNANYNGSDSFTYEVRDSSKATDTATVNVTVTSVEDAPVAEDDTATTNEDTAVTINVLSNDSDGDGDTLTIASVSNPSSGTAQISSGKIEYTPDADWSGSDSFTYSINDGNKGTDSATVSVTVNSVNDAPVATNDTATTNEDTAVTINVLDNDTDADDNDTLSIDSVTSPSHGTAQISKGKVKYTPNANYNGSDDFTYTVSDGNGGTATGTVNVTVTSVNDAPVAANDTATTNEDTAVTINVLSNDSDSDGGTLSVASVANPSNGTAQISSSKVVYTPDANWHGSESFNYGISDGQGGTATATVTVTVTSVNDTPVATNDTATTNEDTSVTIDVLENDTDADKDSLSIDSVTSPSNGTAQISSGEIEYTPTGDYNGSDAFTYTVSDGNGGTATGTVNVTVTSVNDAPVAANDAATTNEDTSVTIAVLANDSDVDGDTLTISSVSNPTNGTAQISNNKVQYTPNANHHGTDQFSYTTSDGKGGTAAATVSVTVTSVNDSPVAANDTATTNEDASVTINVLANDTDVDDKTLSVSSVTSPSNGTAQISSGKVKYTPNANHHGTDQFTYVVSDGNGGTDTATVNITVTSVNDAPVAANDTATTNEDSSVTITVLGNDSDVDGDTLSVASVSSPKNGTAQVSNNKVEYTPDANYHGNDSFTYGISDGNQGTATATVSVTVTSVNDIPVATNDKATTNEDSSITINVLANDSDLDGDTLTITKVSSPSNGTAQISKGKVVYTPNTNYHGSDEFNYSISDGNGGTAAATVSVSVTSVNDIPVAADDQAATNEDQSITIAVLENDSDLDGDTLTIAKVSSPSNGTTQIVNANVVYTPDADYNGSDQFNYSVSDGNGGTAVATVDVTVASVNDIPVAADDQATTKEDESVMVYVLANDTDVDGDKLTIASVSSPSSGTVRISQHGIEYTPRANYLGADQFSYSISDGKGGTASATVNLTVTSVNDAPVATNDSATTNEDTAVTIDVLDNDSDVDGDTLTVKSVANPPNGSAIIVDGGVRYTPDQDYHGTDQFTYEISDEQNTTANGVVNISILPVNDAPVATNDQAETNEDESITVDVLSNDSDVDGDTLTVASASSPLHGTVQVSNGNVFYTPTTNYNGSDQFSYVISDQNGETATATVNLTVRPVNDAPVATNDQAETNVDESVLVDVLANDFDADGDTLTVASVSSPSNGSVLISISDNSVQYIPDADYDGTDQFTYVVSDGQGGTASASVDLTVTLVNEDSDSGNDDSDAGNDDSVGVNNDPVAVDDETETNEDESVTINVLANDSDVDGDPLTIGVGPPVRRTALREFPMTASSTPQTQTTTELTSSTTRSRTEKEELRQQLWT